MFFAEFLGKYSEFWKKIAKILIQNSWFNKILKKKIKGEKKKKKRKSPKMEDIGQPYP